MCSSDLGRVLAPGSPDRSIQPVDVRDLAAFALNTAQHELPGVYNVAAPIGRETFGGMLLACVHVTGSDARFIWVSDDQLIAQQVRQWSEIPLWRTFPGVWQVAADKAVEAGLACRPLAATVADTWSWMLETGAKFGDERAAELGLSREREQQILARVA